MNIANDFKKLRRPKIAVSEDVIVISDPPIGWRIFLTLFCLVLAVFAHLDGGDTSLMGVIVCSTLAAVFLYDSFSLNRARVDLRRKVIFRTTLNPIANLLDRALQHPSEIPFDKITKFEVDYPLLVGRNVPRWYLLVEYDDIYKLKIGIFKNGEDAENVADFLRYKIKMALSGK